MNVGTAMPNMASLRATVFTLFQKKPQAVQISPPPPGRTRVSFQASGVMMQKAAGQYDTTFSTMQDK